MATLSYDVDPGFSFAKAESAFFHRVYKPDPESTERVLFDRFDATVTFSVLTDTGERIEQFEHTAVDVQFDFTWWSAAFRAEAWAAYKASKKLTEV